MCKGPANSRNIINEVTVSFSIFTRATRKKKHNDGFKFGISVSDISEKNITKEMHK